MSFFDDDDETVVSSPRAPRTPPRPRPRPPRHTGAHAAADQHTLMVRRRWAAGLGFALLILIILIVGGCLKSHSQQALETYNHEVGHIIEESDQQVSHPLFATLASASSKSSAEVEVAQQVNQLRLEAQKQVSMARALSVPGSMQAAQRDLLLVLDLREEGLNKIANLVGGALSAQNSNTTREIAGSMEIFLASDVLWSQRVVPLIQEALKSSGATSQSTPASQFLPNLGWLEPATVQQRLTGQSATQNGTVPPGNYGHRLAGVNVGGVKLEPESTGTINHVKGASTPTLTAEVENSGEHIETGVKVDVSVTSNGVTHKVSHTINRTEPGKTVNVDIPLEGVTLGSASKVFVNIEKVPGENDVENNMGTYLVLFEK